MLQLNMFSHICQVLKPENIRWADWYMSIIIKETDVEHQICWFLIDNLSTPVKPESHRSGQNQKNISANFKTGL